MDLEQASASIDALIEKRAGERREANAEEMLCFQSIRRHHEKLRRQRRGEWYCYFAALAVSLRRSADHYERRALELLENDPPEGSK